MILSSGRPACRRLVAVRALGIRRLVCRRLGLGILCQVGAAVTSRTLRKTRMVHRRRSPVNKIAVLVAAIACPGYRNVRRRLSERALRRVCTTMASRTSITSHHGGVIHLGRLEGRVGRSVAGITGSAGRYVGRRFAHGRDAIVAG